MGYIPRVPKRKCENGCVCGLHKPKSDEWKAAASERAKKQRANEDPAIHSKPWTPERRAKVLAAWTPEKRKKAGEKSARNWENPEFRKSMEARWTDEARAEYSSRTSAQLRLQWEDPEYRERMTESTSQMLRECKETRDAAIRERWADPENRKRQSEESRKRWADPEFRSKTLAAMSDAVTEWWRDPERRSRHSEVMREATLRYWIRHGSVPEENRAPRIDRRGLLAIFGEDLRKRDGDLCQLCGVTIDFEIKDVREPSRGSVDHIIPRSWGGKDELDNYWLAHWWCNSNKSAYFSGRFDGSTDIRRS